MDGWLVIASLSPSYRRNIENRLGYRYVDDGFGAKGDGSTDDHDALQAAHDWCASRGLLPKLRDKTYYSSAALTFTDPFDGPDAGHALVTTDLASGTFLNLSNSEASGSRYGFRRMLRNIEFRNTNSSNTATGLWLGGSGVVASSMLFEGIGVSGFHKSHGYNSNAYLVVWESCFFEGNHSSPAGYGITCDAAATNVGESLIYNNCVLAEFAQAIDQQNGPALELIFNGGSFDYNTQVLAGGAQNYRIGLNRVHLEMSAGASFFTVVSSSACSLMAQGCTYVHTGTVTVGLYNLGTNSFVVDRDPIYVTSSNLTNLYNMAQASATLKYNSTAPQYGTAQSGAVVGSSTTGTVVDMG